MKRKFDKINDFNLETEPTSDEKDDEVEKSTEKKNTSEDYYNDTNNDKAEVTSSRNHIYFYCSVGKKSCLKLNTLLKETAQKIIDDGSNHLKKDKYIYLHINSFGGGVFAALSTIDTIRNLKVPVISIIEGGAASAATMISVCCDYRIIFKNSFMLIHQLSSSCWGKMNQLEDEMENLKKLMNRIKGIYKENTNIEDDLLDEILKHDLWWDAKKCLSEGLVDMIKEEGDLIYDFKKEKLDI